ncbi:MAG: damage-inducible protein CinA [Micavibrio aeruginosavorus]|uniref:Damage-inducible protein CinA n=1 Tax=Micavibrio aeruginosavorus TaxID=349221 RepID=A0A2W5A0P5_9BACT|nr:MAG: damage-inducible protein CinA [Micavibrio aeruginosavorus]
MHSLVEELSLLLLNKNLRLASAESCTGGMIAAAITDRAGSSALFERGFVTYANEAKIEELGVQSATIETYGAVSEQTAIEMAQGALKNSHADIAVSVTGIAGPGGGTDLKPVGLVYIGIAQHNKNAIAYKNNFDGDRRSIRQATVEKALELLIETLSTRAV